MVSEFEKIIEKEKSDIWKFAIKHNVPYGALLDFIKNNQVKKT